MPVNPYTASGTTISIAPSASSEPANAAAYAGLTWSAIGNVRSYGDIGDTATIVNAPVIGDNRVRKAKSVRDAGDFVLTVYPDSGDAGQAALVAAELTVNTYPIKIVTPSRLTSGGTDAIYYFLAVITGGRLTIGDNTNVITQAWTFAITTKLTPVAAT